MKVKLLKKIRKRYSIIYYPDGGYWGWDWVEGSWAQLLDNQDSYRGRIAHGTKEETYNVLYDWLKYWIKKDYGVTSRKRKNYKSERLWHK